jgi:hypothetical protein
MTHEFDHYPGCGGRDPDNCSGCALTDLRQDSPNYAAWPLVYMENDRIVPAQWRDAFIKEFSSDNDLYAAKLYLTLKRKGVRFSDGTSFGWHLVPRDPTQHQ